MSEPALKRRKIAESRPSLLNLIIPKEIEDYIFRFLDWWSLFRCLSVCKYWNDHVFEAIDFFMVFRCHENTLDLIDKKINHAQIRRCKICDNWWDPKIENKLGSILLKCTNLIDLTILPDSMDKKLRFSYIAQMTQLKRLSYWGNYVINCMVLPKLTNLEILSFRFDVESINELSQMWLMLTKLTKLQDLEFTLDNAEDMKLISLSPLKHLTQLTRLDINHQSGLDTDLDVKELSPLTNLRDFGFFPTVMETLSTMLTNLDRLKASTLTPELAATPMAQNVTYLKVHAAYQPLNNVLTKLEVLEIEKFTNNALLSLPNLKELRVWSPAFKEPGIFKLPALKKLKLIRINTPFGKFLPTLVSVMPHVTIFIHERYTMRISEQHRREWKKYPNVVILKRLL